MAPGIRQGGTRRLRYLTKKLTNILFWKGEHVAEPGDDDVLNFGARKRLFYDCRKIFENDNGFGAAIRH